MINIETLKDMIPNKNLEIKLSEYRLNELINPLTSKSIIRDYYGSSISKIKDRNDFYHWASMGSNTYSLMGFTTELEEYLDRISTGPKFLSYLGGAIRWSNNSFVDPKGVMDRIIMVHSILYERGW